MLVQTFATTRTASVLNRKIPLIINKHPELTPGEAVRHVLDDAQAMEFPDAISALNHLLKKADNIYRDRDVSPIMELLDEMVTDFGIKEDGQNVETPLVIAYSFSPNGQTHTHYVPVNKVLYIQKEMEDVRNGYKMANAYCVLNDGQQTKLNLSSDRMTCTEIIADIQIKAALEVVARWQQR